MLPRNGRVAVGEDVAPSRGDPVALIVIGGKDRGGGVELIHVADRGAEVGGVAEVVHHAVGEEQPVAVPVPGGHGVDHGHR